ncbi:hypothetical protein [Flavobacterium dankookense]|uniref:Uncharacterized protein n=1 Tax=Flavobacterium dankookense TaxID=706186 RepID=A0A4R6Q6V0_9FLAO|nr:hypothetical protein [Flavobacterium dankookense]TDP57775.1 hypothetical protein BC748_2592 [Flavobacterium dankookense]
MSKTTFKDYKKLLQNHYERSKSDRFSGLLDSPSPAQIRTLCVALCEKELSRKDDEVFRLFFETKEGELLKKSIDHCNIDRFRPIISFLKNETDTENRVRVEMAAILCGFEPRPYSEFSKKGFVEEEKSFVFTEERNGFDTIIDKTVIGKKSTFKKKVAVGVLGLAVTFLAGFGIKEIVIPKKECMVWRGVHYERIDCQDETLGLVSEIVKPFDEKEFELRKIEVCDTTTFFKNGKAVVWYGKKDGEVTYFNQDGRNPENGDELKEITQYMIDKYVLESE